MIAYLSDSYKYYLPKVYVITFLDDVYLSEITFARINTFKISKISPVGHNSSQNMINFETRAKQSNESRTS